MTSAINTSFKQNPGQYEVRGHHGGKRRSLATFTHWFPPPCGSNEGINALNREERLTTIARGWGNCWSHDITPTSTCPLFWGVLGTFAPLSRPPLVPQCGTVWLGCGRDVVVAVMGVEVEIGRFFGLCLGYRCFLFFFL